MKVIENEIFEYLQHIDKNSFSSLSLENHLLQLGFTPVEIAEYINPCANTIDQDKTQYDQLRDIEKARQLQTQQQGQYDVDTTNKATDLPVKAIPDIDAFGLSKDIF